jgi:hypothetical protein
MVKIHWYNLYTDEKKQIGEKESIEQAWKLIADYIKGMNFQSYYYRCWEENGCTYVDYGSHTYWFIIEPIHEEGVI